jgi:allophanate hydrolase
MSALKKWEKKMTEWVEVAVCGAHMSGLPLNHQLLGLGGQLVARTMTAPHYRLYRLPGFEPPRPGLIRVHSEGGAVEVEVWRLPVEHYGKLVAVVPAPLCIGTLDLQDGLAVQGFLCESYATEHALDITSSGGWRSYLASQTGMNPTHKS